MGSCQSAKTPDDEIIRDFVRRTRAEQGLPPTIEDPVVLDMIVDILGLANPPATRAPNAPTPSS